MVRRKGNGKGRVRRAESELTIRQIIPALPSWYAVLKDGDGEVRHPVACWALLDFSDGDEHVSGMILHEGRLSLCEGSEEFLAFTGPGHEWNGSGKVEG